LPHGVFGAADGVLHFAGMLFGRAFNLGFGVAGKLANALFNGTLNFVADASDAIFIHDVILSGVRRFSSGWRVRRYQGIIGFALQGSEQEEAARYKVCANMGRHAYRRAIALQLLVCHSRAGS